VSKHLLARIKGKLPFFALILSVCPVLESTLPGAYKKSIRTRKADEGGEYENIISKFCYFFLDN
jgi:hypothetical protein